jgi:hypothetical protein
MRIVTLASTYTFRSAKASTRGPLTGSFPIQHVAQKRALKPVAFGKGTYTSLPLDCRFEQQNNVVVVQYERMTSHVAACEQCGDFSFECDWRFSGQLTSLRGQTKQHVSVFDTAIWFADGLKLILPAAAGAGDDLKGAQQDRGAIRSGHAILGGPHHHYVRV